MFAEHWMNVRWDSSTEIFIRKPYLPVWPNEEWKSGWNDDRFNYTSATPIGSNPFSINISPNHMGLRHTAQKYFPPSSVASSASSFNLIVYTHFSHRWLLLIFTFSAPKLRSPENMHVIRINHFIITTKKCVDTILFSFSLFLCVFVTWNHINIMESAVGGLANFNGTIW